MHEFLPTILPQPEPGEAGRQRLPLEKLRRFLDLGHGCFFHVGLATFTGKEKDEGLTPASAFAPQSIELDQWLDTAAAFSARYATLTAKHVTGFCLWPSAQTDHHIGHSPYGQDLVGRFVEACRARGIEPGIYYCAWDDHHKLGSKTWSDLPMEQAFTTPAYHEFMTRQLEELLTGYGDFVEVWIDIPALLPRGFRERLYADIAGWQPDAVVNFNQGCTDGREVQTKWVWPTDVLTIEKFYPNGVWFAPRWRQIEDAWYFLPHLICEQLGYHWFYHPKDRCRTDSDLLGGYLAGRSRGCNYMVNLGPGPDGGVPQWQCDALARLRANIDALPCEVSTTPFIQDDSGEAPELTTVWKKKG